MQSYKQPLAFTPSMPTLTANQFTYPLDSTKRMIVAPTASAAAQAPGSYRHAYAGGRVRMTIKADQTMTATLQLYTDPTSSAAAGFETDTTAQSSGVVTVTGGTTQIIDWAPRTNDYRVQLQAGGTPPTSLLVIGQIYFSPAPVV